jgi:thiol-disulfide isomerase/thioredoxin
MSEDEINPSPEKYRVSKRTKMIFLLCFFLSIGCYVFFVAERRIAHHNYIIAHEMAAAKLIATKVPDLIIKDMSTGEKLNLRSLSGSWLLLHLWATWCPSCVQEMPSLAGLEQKLGGSIKIVALSVDDSEDALKDFISTRKPGFGVYFDEAKLSQASFGIDKFPETFLLNPEGMLVAQFSGPRDWSSEAAIRYLKNILGK